MAGHPEKGAKVTSGQVASWKALGGFSAEKEKQKTEAWVALAKCTLERQLYYGGIPGWGMHITHKQI